MEHAEIAFWQDALSLKSGNGFEHQMPHLYSQVRATVGVTSTTEVQRLAAFVVVVVLRTGVVVVDGAWLAVVQLVLDSVVGKVEEGMVDDV